jgi:hypothetical protein
MITRATESGAFDLLQVGRSKALLYLSETILTDTFAIEKYDIVSVVAEYASGLILLKDYLVIICEDFQGILFIDIHVLSNADWKNDSTKLVDFSDYTSRFHV